MVSYKIGNYKKYLLKTLFFHAEVLKMGPESDRHFRGLHAFFHQRVRKNLIFNNLQDAVPRDTIFK